MSFLGSILPTKITSKVGTWMDVIKALPFDGGPSVTRWVFVRTAEVISLGWLGLVFGAVWEYVRVGKVDAIYCGMIVTLGMGLFGFSQNAQTTKLAIDSKTPGAAGSVESSALGATVIDDGAKQ